MTHVINPTRYKNSLYKIELELLYLELEFATKNEIQLNLPFNFLIQKYFFHDNPTWNINYSEYVRYILGVDTHCL